MAVSLRVSVFPLAILLPLLLLQEQQYSVTSYIPPLSCGTKGNALHKLYSSPNVFTGLRPTSGSDGDDDNRRNDRIDIQKESNKPSKNIEFVNFWGSKVATNNNDDNETLDPRSIPFVPTLDVRDGPLPPGAYIMEGKSEFDAKTTCRIMMDVIAGNGDIMDDPDEVVRRLQSCIDAGFDSFQLHDQTPRSLGIIRRMNDHTPSYINRHWSVGMEVPQPSPDSDTVLTTKSDLRHIILNLIEQTGGDALDSLQIDCGNLPTTTSISSNDATLEIFEHLVDLQREGWIRSIGLRDTESQKLRHEVKNYFGEHIDFEQGEGSLLVPPTLGLCIPKSSSNNNDNGNNIRMSNALAGGLLTNLYSNDWRRTKKTIISSPSRSQPLLTNANMDVLKEWSKRREATPASLWQQYQEDVVGQLNWIASKHDVSVSAVALRWALECGSGANEDAATREGPTVSSALAGLTIDDPKKAVIRKLEDLRQVFRFRLDEEDKEILFVIAAIEEDNEIETVDDDEYPDIDFNNRLFWL